MIRTRTSAFAIGICCVMPMLLPAQVGASLTTSIGAAAVVFAGASTGRVIAVLDFPTLDNRATLLGAFVSEELSVDLANALAGKGSVVERRQILQVLQEERLTTVGLTSREAVRVGKKLGADLVVIGTMTVLGSEVVINARAVSTDSAIVAKAFRIDGFASSELIRLADQTGSSASAGGDAKQTSPGRAANSGVEPPAALAEPAPCVRGYVPPNPGNASGQPIQRADQLTMALMPMNPVGATQVRIVVGIGNAGGLGAIAVALRPKNSGAKASDNPKPNVELSDGQGAKYELESTSGLSLLASRDDWTVIGPCETRNVVFLFNLRALGTSSGWGFSLTADLWIAVRGPDQRITMQSLTMYMQRQ